MENEDSVMLCKAREFQGRNLYQNQCKTAKEMITKNEFSDLEVTDDLMNHILHRIIIKL